MRILILADMGSVVAYFSIIFQLFVISEIFATPMNYCDYG